VSQLTLWDDGPPQEPVVGPPRFTPAQLARLLGLDEPTPVQSAVISAPLAPLAVIAGAGSGKSETMAARLVWLVANGYMRPERVLGLTFTRKAAAELASRVRSRLDGLRRVGLAEPVAGQRSARLDRPDEVDLAGDPVIATYHSYGARLIADHALREAMEPTMRLITPAVAWQLAARNVAAYDGPMDAVDWAPVTVTAAVVELSAELAEHLRGPDDVLAAGDWLRRRFDELQTGRRARAEAVMKSQRVREQLLPLVRAYAAAKAEREVIDYGDQMALAARIAMAHPEVGRSERARYQVVLLDEFQDTSHAQLELMRALFGDGHPVTAVGDPCQSIYGWRGASAGNMRRFADLFPPRDHDTALRTGRDTAQGARAEVRLLSTSFRNTGRVLDVAELVDVLFVDDAAQMSLANVLAIPQAAKMVVLIGDLPRRSLNHVGRRSGRRTAADCRGRRRTVTVARRQDRRGPPSDIAGCAGSGPSSPLCSQRGRAPVGGRIGGLLTVPEVPTSCHRAGAAQPRGLRLADQDAHLAPLADRSAGPGGAARPGPGTGRRPDRRGRRDRQGRGHAGHWRYRPCGPG
jgi:DNA helicase-2/ATP-dependent DNA helicase PcrA